MINYSFIQKVLVGCLSKPGLYDAQNYTGIIEERNDLSHQIEYLVLDSLKFDRTNDDELDKSRKDFNEISNKIESIRDTLNFKVKVSNILTSINNSLNLDHKKVDEIIKSFDFIEVSKFTDIGVTNYRINDFIVNKVDGKIVIKKNGIQILKDLELIGCLITIRSGDPILVFDKDYAYKVNCSFNDIFIEKYQPLTECSGLLGNYLKKHLRGYKYLSVTNEEFINITRINSKVEMSLLLKNNMNRDLYIICRGMDKKQHCHKLKLKFPKEVLPYIDLDGFTVHKRNLYRIYLIKSKLFTSINYLELDCNNNTVESTNGDSFKGNIISDYIQLDLKQNMGKIINNLDTVEGILKQHLNEKDTSVITLFLKKIRKELYNG